VVLLLASKGKVTTRSGRAVKAYHELMTKSGLVEEEPNGVKESVREKLLGKKTGPHLISVILYTTPQKKDSR
jgi:hypothetical protein